MTILSEPGPTSSDGLSWPSKPRRGRPRGSDYADARLHPPRLVMIYGVRTFSAATRCSDIHPGGPIPDGSLCCCASCHKSGVDAHPSLKVSQAELKAIADFNPKDQWSKRDRPAEKPTKYDPAKPKTRRQRRREDFGDPNHAQPMDPARIEKLIAAGKAERFA